MKRDIFVQIPCGKALGHGEKCLEGHFCSECNYILKLERKIKTYENSIKKLKMTSKKILLKCHQQIGDHAIRSPAVKFAEGIKYLIENY